MDQQTHQELLDMMGVESCNPCANRLMATVGNGSATAGAQRVTAAMQRLGLSNFRLCAPFQVVERWEDDSPLRVSYGTLFGHDLIWAGYSPDQQSGFWLGVHARCRLCLDRVAAHFASLRRLSQMKSRATTAVSRRRRQRWPSYWR